MIDTIKKKHIYFMVISLVFIVGGFLAYFLIVPNLSTHQLGDAEQLDDAGLLKRSSIANAEPVSAAEIYPEFTCSCCGKTIDNCDCGIAVEAKAYIDGQVDAGLSELEVIINGAKKFGLNSLANESLQYMIKSELARRAPTDRPKIVITPEYYDLGNVSQSKGKVSTIFRVKNEGNTDLIIESISTSCGCTQASLEVKGIKSPYFGMHNNPTNWSQKLLPGEIGELEVIYDPNHHPEFRGYATRIIYIKSNDPIDFQKEVRIEFNQVE
ncbi:MAG: DUF1573 domain-containing protein [Methanosarcinales archaeon]